MAYRFLLEVPESLASEAGVAVAQASDAQVILVRQSHGLGVDEPLVDLTVAAHSLRVIETLYDWFGELGASRPDLQIVLHSGERVALEERERGEMVAAIRRDQPWVERTVPQIGVHEEDSLVTAGNEVRLHSDRGVATAEAVRTDRAIHIKALSHVVVRVADLPKAEQFYGTFFAMSLRGRARRGPGGGYVPLNADYRWSEAIATGTEADVTMMSNGPITLALHRAGRGALIDRHGSLDAISIAVDASTFATLRGEILMRGFVVHTTAATALTFTDPFGITWEMTIQGTPGFA